MLPSFHPERHNLGSTPGGMPASGVFLRSTFMFALLSVPAFGGADCCPFKGGQIFLPVGYLPHSFRERRDMLYAFIIIGIVLLFAPHAYAIWYARTGQYELDNRLDSATRR